MTMANVRIVSFGKFAVGGGHTPYYVAVEPKEGVPPSLLGCTEEVFFKLINNLVTPVVQACGMAHVHTVSIPDEELANAPLEPERKILLPNGH
jgi:hypothetical protein